MTVAASVGSCSATSSEYPLPIHQPIDAMRSFLMFGCDFRNSAHELSRGVPEDRALRDLHAAVEFLKSQPNIRKDRIASIGWCMGGGYSLDVALQEPTLAATVINYGHLSTDPAAIQKIHSAILG